MGTMTHIFEKVFLACTYAHARDNLREVLQGFARTGTVQRLALDEGVALVRYEQGSDPTHFDDVWQVYWTTDGGGAYPDFGGAISVQAGEALGGAMLELHGDFTPPLGNAGEPFDFMAAQKMASAAGRALLSSIAGKVETHRVA